jgi:hypothetical protein
MLYQLMQMAYLINQLMVISIHFQADYLKGKNHHFAIAPFP